MFKKKSIVIFCDSDKNVGLGHYSRSIALKKLIKKNIKNVKVSIIVISSSSFFLKKGHKVFTFRNLNTKINNSLDLIKPSHIFFNLSPQFEKKKFKSLIGFIIEKKIKLIGIDNLFDYSKFLDHIWVPNIYLNSQFKKNKKFFFGWDKLLIDETENLNFKKKKSILIVTGGADKYNLYKKLPPLLEKNCVPGTIISWVVGPYANSPIIKKTKLKWNFYHKPKNLKKIYSKSSVAFVVFGISFFEIVNHSIPCTVYSPKSKESKALVKEIKKNFYIGNNLKLVVKNLVLKLNDIKKENSKAQKLAKLINFKKRDSFIKKLI